MSKLPEYPATSERVNHPLIPSITSRRLNNFFQADYASQNVAALLNKKRVYDEDAVKIRAWSASGMDKPTLKEGLEGLKGDQAKTIKKGYVFGPSWTNHWLEILIKIPAEFQQAKQPVIFEFDPSCEALIFTENGEALHGITGTSKWNVDCRRTEHIIPEKAVAAGTYKIYAEVSCNGLFGAGMDGRGWAPPDMNMHFPLIHADIILPNIAVREMYADFRALQQISQSKENRASDLPKRAMKAANELINAFVRVDGDVEDPDLLLPVIKNCRKIAWSILGSLTEEDKANLAPSNPKVQERAKVWAIGHCHIDTAWLWRYTQTQQKVARSWTTQCDLMDRWSNHQFAASSAQQYLWLEKLYPDAFERVKKYVLGGRFHAVGGAWLEHDSNMPCGESLVRQYLYGQRYFKSRFGEYCKEAWLPDTFGYASQLPQILRQAGMKYFFTQKLSWNNITVFPYNTFNWIGLDGSTVLAHLAPADTYNAQCNFSELEMCVWNHKNVADAPESLLLFGNGDGGGGPTPEMLEKLERLSSVAINNGEVPAFKIAKPADFFDRLLVISEGGQTLPSWRGELYLEFHRGTYTTQSNIKKGNRTMERLLRDLEYFATMASITQKDYKYPRQAIEEMWQDTMLNQFHDVLPGTTISMVVDDVLEIYRKRVKQAEQLIEEALTALYPGSRAVQSSKEVDDNTIVVDPLRLDRKGDVAVLEDGNVTVTANKAISGVSTDQDGPKAYEDQGKYILENGDFKMTIANGRIVSLVDRQLDREIILAGPGADNGGLNIYEDYPLEWDAWDVEVYHLETYKALQFQEIKPSTVNGRAVLTATARFGQSTAVLKFSIGAAQGKEGSNQRSYIRIDADFDWHEEHKVIKFVLPVDIHSPHATYGTQFGLIERPTHRNTPYDQAKFEVCGHMLGDLSEMGYGVSLSSSHKYGYAIEGNVIRMSLLRGPRAPDPTTDKGEHQFSLAIMPHVGYLQDGNTYKQAMAFTNPVYLRAGGSAGQQTLPTFDVSGPNKGGIILETIKTAEDSDSIVLRMYEALGGRGKGCLEIGGISVAKAQWGNILEEEAEEAVVSTAGEKAAILLEFRAFEIKTLIIEVKK